MAGILLTLGILITLAAGCYKEGLPEEQDYFSKDMNYSINRFVVNLGRTNPFVNIFNADYSSEPLTFSILDVRHNDGSPAPELRQEIPVKEWKEYYSGDEKSIAEITAKQQDGKSPVLYIRPNSGEIFFRNTDSSKVKIGTYRFDVKVSNGGGEKIFSDMQLDVRLPHPYEPYEYDDSTGLLLPPDEGGVIHPNQVSGVMDMLERTLPADSVNVYFVKTGDAKNTLTFKFFDEDSTIIPLTRFNMMQWDSLHYRSGMIGADVFPFAFNRRFDSDSTAVTYDIPNPFPVLADVSGNTDRASITFKYNRASFGQRKNASIGLSFAIYAPGEWQVIFKFKIDPKFDDD
ncbi:DUF5007 domain-containing protein [Compostibacter hankyongensis]|uniref:DUF5007 domain-containing protein n=2 Tax=Compostibacter hankyongensis TaxID=1007089 RepID=A0ABP8FT19_9BACT